MKWSRIVWHLAMTSLVICFWTNESAGQQSLTWQEVRSRFEAASPILRASQLNVEESRAQETTAYLRPNPQVSALFDQVGPTIGGNALSASTLITGFNYLRERQGKRELRRDSAQQGTAIAESARADQERTLLFSLRNAFVQTLQSKAIFTLARENLAYYDQLLSVDRDRFQAGDISEVDLNRLELQRVQYEADLETSTVNVRTAKIQLLTLMNDRTPVESFDVMGPFDFMEQIPTLDEFHTAALDARPDLRAAMQAIEKARTDHRLAIANGSADPTLGIDAGFPSISQAFLSFQPPLRWYMGFSASVPLRIFDRNQGEKLRTQQDISRTEQLRDATVSQIFSDVDSAYAALTSSVNLLRPYKEKYLAQSLQIRDTISFSYQQGAASLLDFLNAQNDYRTTQRAYLNLIGSYLTAAAQLNLAVGREVLP